MRTSVYSALPLVFCAVFLAATGAFGQVISFSQPQTYSDSLGIVQVIVADFNNDGKRDFACFKQWAGGSIDIFLGKGDGTFTGPVTTPLESPRSIAFADFNGDGKLDIVSNSNDTSVQILLGNGDGTFGSPSVINGYGPIGGYATGDFNRDGNVDFAATDFLGGAVLVFLGDGHGGFAPPVPYAAGAGASPIAATDLNGDGKLDLVVVNVDPNGDLAVLLGNGDGSFQPATHYAVDQNAAPYYGFAVGDLNGDGRPDVVVSETGNHIDGVAVFLGNGDGTLTLAHSYMVSGGLWSLAISDVTLDGLPDIIVSVGTFGAAVSVLPGTGGGTFGTQIDLPVLTSNYAATGDFNGDQKPDLVSVDMTSGANVLLNTTSASHGITSNLSITSTHAHDFVSGGYGIYTLTVSNAPSGVATSGTVIVVDNPVDPLYPAAITGSGWSCVASVCSREDQLNPGSSYPPITVTMQISPSGPSQVTNQPRVSGGGSPTATASDVTNIITGVAALDYPIPGSVLSSSSHSFYWTSITGADQYRLDVGSAAGLGDYFTVVTGDSYLLVNSLPCDGSTIYVRLWTHMSSGWQPPQEYTLGAASSCADRPNVVAYWKLNEGSGAISFVDSSGNGNTGACSGSGCPTMGAQGKVATAAEFNGLDNQIIIPDSAALRLNQFTIALWVFPRKVGTDYQPLVVKEDSDGHDRNYGLYIVPTTMQIRYAVWGSDCATRFAANSSGRLALNRWNHIAFTYDGIREKLYLNGVLDSFNVGGWGYLCQTSAPVKLGMETSAFEPFSGMLDEVQVFNVALDGVGVIGAYNALAAHWELDEAVGTTSFIDASGNDNTGTCFGSACPTLEIRGEVGTASEFDGVGNQIIDPDSASLRLNQFTMVLWVYPTQQKADYQLLMAKEDSIGHNRNYGLYIVPNSMRIRYAAWAGDCMTRFAANTASQLTLNAWNQVAFTYDGVTEKVYLNGVLDSSNAAASPSLCQAAVPVKLGMETSAFLPFSGGLDDVQIYSQALSGSAVLRLYHPPVAYWKLDEGSGATIFDDAPSNGNTGYCGSSCPTMGVPGEIGTAAEFNGVNNQIVIPDSPSLRLNQFTIALWVFPKKVGTDYQPLVVKEDSDGHDRNYGLYIVPNTMQIRYAAWGADCVTRFAGNSTGHLAPNAWNHIGFTYDGTVEKLYLNGVLDSSNASPGGLLCQAAVPVKLGMETSAFVPFEGSLDEIQIFDQALSAAGAMSLYSNP